MQNSKGLILQDRDAALRLTVEQRLKKLERDNVVLHDTIGILHKIIKEQRQLICDYISQKLVLAECPETGCKTNGRPVEEIYTFVCSRRFDKIEKDIRKLAKLKNHLGSD
ncbi:MAG: hypothetical protein JXB29_12950 [Sedimentisphaerales bacterium]|nr:hypothetical protein [Sedimentisphaerales bacterium]